MTTTLTDLISLTSATEAQVAESAKTRGTLHPNNTAIAAVDKDMKELYKKFDEINALGEPERTNTYAALIKEAKDHIDANHLKDKVSKPAFDKSIYVYQALIMYAEDTHDGHKLVNDKNRFADDFVEFSAYTGRLDGRYGALTNGVSIEQVNTLLAKPQDRQNGDATTIPSITGSVELGSGNTTPKEKQANKGNADTKGRDAKYVFGDNAHVTIYEAGAGLTGVTTPDGTTTPAANKKEIELKPVTVTGSKIEISPEVIERDAIAVKEAIDIYQKGVNEQSFRKQVKYKLNGMQALSKVMFAAHGSKDGTIKSQAEMIKDEELKQLLIKHPELKDGIDQMIVGDFQHINFQIDFLHKMAAKAGIASTDVENFIKHDIFGKSLKEYKELAIDTEPFVAPQPKQDGAQGHRKKITLQ